MGKRLLFTLQRSTWGLLFPSSQTVGELTRWLTTESHWSSARCASPPDAPSKARLDQELKLIGEYGLRNKKEVWRVKYTLAKIRKASRELLTLDEKDPKRLFEGNAL